MKVDNPYAAKVQELTIALDQEKDPGRKLQLQQDLDAARHDSQEFIQALIHKYDSKIQTVVQQKEIIRKKPWRSLRGQYNAAIKLYRSVAGYKDQPGLIHELRAFKRACQLQMEAGRIPKDPSEQVKLK